MTPRDGQRVSYIGFEQSGLGLGDQGKVVSASGTGSHVKWATGSRAGSITLENNDDLALTGAANSRTAVADELSDSLEFGSLIRVAVRDVYDAQGEVGLINALNEAGHLASLAQVAEDAFNGVAQSVRSTPSMQAVLAELEPEEGDALVVTATSALLRDAFGGE